MSTFQNITVHCKAAGDPKPNVTWMKENGKLPVGRSKVGVDGTLKIWNPKVEDSGKYTCTATSNNIFTKAVSTKLAVKGKNELELSFIVLIVTSEYSKGYRFLSFARSLLVASYLKIIIGSIKVLFTDVQGIRL